jgi:hypothetical protein
VVLTAAAAIEYITYRPVILAAIYKPYAAAPANVARIAGLSVDRYRCATADATLLYNRYCNDTALT